STIGMRKMSPGPFVPIERPSRKITPRSYSRSTLMELVRRRIPMNRTVKNEYETIRDPLLGLLDLEREPVDTIHDDGGALGDRSVRLSGPVLAVEKHLSRRGEVGQRRPAFPDEPLNSRDRLSPLSAVRRAENEHEEGDGDP